MRFGFFLNHSTALACLSVCLFAVCQGIPCPAHTRPLCSSLFNMLEDDLPSITYGSSRTSSKWIKGGFLGKVAVDEGIEYEGRTYYLSLMSDLIATTDEDGEEKTIWANNVGGFWNTLAIEKLELEQDGEKTEILVVAIRGKSGDQEFVEYYDRETGEKIDTAQQNDLPDGEALEVDKVWSGNFIDNEDKLFRVFETEEEWSEFHADNFGTDRPEPPRESAFNPATEILVLIAQGATFNCGGISIDSAFENDDRLLVRLLHHTYQSAGATPTVHPFGVFVLPRKEGKQYVVEQDVQNMIMGPEIWKELESFKID